jgi:hypothetical protein
VYAYAYAWMFDRRFGESTGDIYEIYTGRSRRTDLKGWQTNEE